MKTNMYITGAGCIVPKLNKDKFLCPEPEYKDYIDLPLIRKINRITKLGIVAAKTALSVAAVTMPDGIIVGTGMGCLEYTEKFLIDIILNSEKLLNPSCFINSTHNTVSSQIAIVLKCHNYNITYTHRTFSFESALIDAGLHFRENTGKLNLLIGGIDELSDEYYNITRRFGKWRKTMPGEGATMFCLSNENNNAIAKIEFVQMLYNVSGYKAVTEKFNMQLHDSGLEISDIDLVLCGGDGFVEKVFPEQNITYYKQSCGEYHTSTAFAVWLAVQQFKSGPKPCFRILIYNHQHQSNHSFILVTKC
jgi:hypothetical protein